MANYFKDIQVLLVLVILTWKGSQAVILKKIVVGVLYVREYESMMRTIDFIITKEIKHRILPEGYPLTPIKVKVDGKNLLSRDVTAALSTAVCIFDLYTGNKDAYALAEMLRVPLIIIDALYDDPPNDFVLSIRPPYTVVSQALYDIAIYFKFRDVALLYDVRMNRQATNFHSLARSEERFTIHLMPELNLKGDLETPLTILKNSYIKNVILVCDQKDIAHIMNKALHVGFNSKDYKWIVSDIEVAGPNKTYPSILGMVGLSLHLTDRKASESLQRVALSKSVGGGKMLSPVAYSALNDSVHMVARAIRSYVTTGTLNKIYPSTSNDNCPLRKQPGQAGTLLLKTIKKISHRGMTGPITFDSKGNRRAKRGFDILNILQDNVEKVGSWKPNQKLDSDSIIMKTDNPVKWVGDFAEFVKCHNPGKPGEESKPPRPLLKITAVIEPPFVEWSNGTIETRPVSNTSLQGFLLDLINELSIRANFDYQILLRKDFSYGRVENGKWNGMVGDLVNKKADLAMSPITITAERESVIDFSKPFMDFSMSLIMQNMEEDELDLFAFVNPFSGAVWILIIAVVLFVTVLMYVVNLLSPFEHLAEARETGEGAGDEFNLFNSLWFATASMLQQGGDNTPKSPSGRILAAAFWFFILIIISTYTANLAAFFTIKGSKSAINSLDDLAKQSEIKYGISRGGSTRAFFENSQVSLYRTMYSQMRQHDTFEKNTRIGVNKARKEKYAYLSEQPFLDYYNNQNPCNTVLLNNLLTAKSYGFGMQRNSPYVNQLSIAILELRENGFVERLRKKWWDDRSECTAKSDDGGGNTVSLGVKNMAGVFIILLGGVVLSLFLIVIEIKCKRLVDMLTKTQKREKKKENQSQDIRSQENCCGEEEEDEDEPTENLAELQPLPKRPNHLRLLPDIYANTPESKL